MKEYIIKFYSEATLRIYADDKVNPEYPKGTIIEVDMDLMFKWIEEARNDPDLKFTIHKAECICDLS